jgi:hypothetical protein
MIYTAQQLVDHARIPLQDNAKVRYTDAVLLTYLNDAVRLTLKNRPDLFIGNWAAFDGADLTLTDPVPIPALYRSAVSDYIAGRAELTDDEYSENNRSVMLIQSFLLGLKQ